MFQIKNLVTIFKKKHFHFLNNFITRTTQKGFGRGRDNTYEDEIYFQEKKSKKLDFRFRFAEL